MLVAGLKVGKVLAPEHQLSLTESTFGIRLYTPNGVPGVNSTNDWEENGNLLHLQV